MCVESAVNGWNGTGSETTFTVYAHSNFLLNEYAVMANTWNFVQPRTEPTAVDSMDTFVCAKSTNTENLCAPATRTHTKTRYQSPSALPLQTIQNIVYNTLVYRGPCKAACKRMNK